MSSACSLTAGRRVVVSARVGVVRLGRGGGAVYSNIYIYTNVKQKYSKYCIGHVGLLLHSYELSFFYSSFRNSVKTIKYYTL